MHGTVWCSVDAPAPNNLIRKGLSIVSNSEAVLMSPEEITKMQLHSSAGGKHAALCDVVRHLRSIAGDAYANGRDDEAAITRKLAEYFEGQRRIASAELDAHIRARLESSMGQVRNI